MRNPIITTLKAIAIILVVVAHSCCPTYLSQFAYMLCVSLFFMASGYCFNTKYLSDEATFVKRRMKALYLPFVKWSVFFLVLNQFWFYTGFLNEQYGNAARGVTHPLSLHDWLQSLWSIVFNMSGYDQFLCGAYWFFRALLISSVLFLAGLKLVQCIKGFKDKHSLSAVVVAAVCVLLALWQTSDGLKMTGIAQGGYRELMGVFFLAAGFLYRQLEVWREGEPSAEPLFSTEKEVSKYLAIAKDCANSVMVGIGSVVRAYCSIPFLSMVVCGVATGFLSYYVHPSMSAKANSLTNVLWLALSGVVGFSFIYNFSRFLRRIKPFRSTLNFIGENTIYVLGWHLLAFKLVSMIKVGAYHLPWNMVGCYPVVHSDEGKWFWILYTIIGVALPLGAIWGIRRFKQKYDIQSKSQFMKVFFALTCSVLAWALKGLAQGTKKGSKQSWKGISKASVSGWDKMKIFFVDIVNTVKDSANVNQDDYDDDDEYDEEEDYDDDEYEDDYDDEEDDEEYDDDDDEKK